MARKRLILLTGEEGVGKTALLTKLVSHVAADGSLVLAVTAVPGMAVEDLVLAAGGGLTGEDGSPAADLDTVVERIEARMEQTGAGLLAVDNAHDLDRAALRDLVDLVQTETEETGRFLQVLLAGSPGLENRFAADPTLDSAIRRFGARCRLEPLREADVMALIHHRLRVAGGRNDLFEPETIERVAWLSGGLPGRILPLCAAALITAQERDQDTVGPNMVPALSAGGAPINAEPDPLPSYQEAAAYQEVPAASFRPIEPPREPPGQG
ncbi:MAG TPA: ATP-binding protein, partial [Azospirillaceae bacterium]|nr:ATP-binding protein [Azospirillaceae bacterium]